MFDSIIICFNTDYFKFYLSKAGEYNEIQDNVENNIGGESIISRVAEDKEPDEIIAGSEKENNLDINFFELFKMLYDVDLLSSYLYIITFALFPGCCVKQRLFETGKYRQTTIVTINNPFGTLGRSIISKIKPTKYLIYIIVFGRTVLLFTIILNFYLDMNDIIGPNLSSIFLIINISALAFTNGMATSLFFGLSPALVPDKIKGRAGGSISFFNILGIFIGTCFGFLTNYIMGQIGEYNGD